MSERVRFSPAPTGHLHLGGARTALFNWLVARGSGGTFRLRIEDTDASRSESRFEAAILEDLAWLGLDWDEGPDIGGPNGPYRQSERAEVYGHFFAELLEREAVYPCFCTPEKLAADRAEDVAAGRPPRYRGRCDGLTAARVPSDECSTRSPAWRFRVPAGQPLVWEDVVYGTLSFSSDDFGDFVIRREDGTPTWEFASWCDDVWGDAVTTVVRGADHIPNTPKQLMLSASLSLPAPRYAHVPLVVDAAGEPLSKSSGAPPISELRAQGYVPSAVVNHLALLGWSDPAGREILSREELVDSFDLSRVSTAPSAHDPARLRWLGGRHLRALDPNALVAVVSPFLRETPEWLDRSSLAEALRDELDTGSDAARLAAPLVSPAPLDDEARGALKEAGPSLEAAHGVVLDSPEPLRLDAAEELKAVLRESGIAPRMALPAVRAALTGRVHGLPVGVIMELLGRTRVLERLTAAAERVDSAKA